MSANPIDNARFYVPIWGGLLEHRKKIGNALWVFIWAVVRTTREVAGPDGCMEGLVLWGRPICASEIGDELQMETRTVQNHLNHLVSTGYLRRVTADEYTMPREGGGFRNQPPGPSGAYRYAVRRSKKWQTKLSIVGGVGCTTGDDENNGGAKNFSLSAKTDSSGAKKDSSGAKKIAPLYKKKKETENKQDYVEEIFDANLSLSSSFDRKENLDRLINDVWLYFLDQTGKSANQYRFTAARRTLGLLGFESLVRFAKKEPDPLDAASRLFRLAVDRMAESPFHNGKNDRGKCYLDWHLLFKGKDFEAPGKLLEFWLDDSRWPA